MNGNFNGGNTGNKNGNNNGNNLGNFTGISMVDNKVMLTEMIMEII